MTHNKDKYHANLIYRDFSNFDHFSVLQNSTMENHYVTEYFRYIWKLGLASKGIPQLRYCHLRFERSSNV